MLDVGDIDELSVAVRNNSTNLKYDVNHDGSVDGSDRVHWIESLRHTWIGDSNLDGEFNSRDFTGIFRLSEYENAAVGDSTWAEGDWNGDSEFDSSDFVFAFQANGYERGPRPNAVPEPIIPLFALGLATTLVARRRPQGAR